MEEYPGVSSYMMMQKEKLTFKAKRIFRDGIRKVMNPSKPWLEENSYQFKQEGKKEVHFKLFPYSWKHCFPETRDCTDQEIKAKMLEALEFEQSKIERRKLDPNRLKRQSLVAAYQPKKFGKRMICLSAIISLRRAFIKVYRSLCTQADVVYSEWRNGNRIPYPLGLFSPSLPRTANLLTDAVWT